MCPTLALLKMAGQVARPQLVEFSVQCDMGLPVRSKRASYEGKGEVTLLKLAEGVTDAGNARCWIRALDDPREDKPWIVVVDDRMLDWLLREWSHDSRAYQVVFRPKGRSSPNTTPPESPVDVLPSLKTMDIRDCDNTIDRFTLEEVDTLGEDAVSLSDGKIKLKVHGERLLEYVKNEIARGKALNEIRVGGLSLSNNVWVSSLLRQNKCETDNTSTSHTITSRRYH